MNRYTPQEIEDAIYCTEGAGLHGDQAYQCFHDGGDRRHTRIRIFAIDAAAALAGVPDPEALVRAARELVDNAPPPLGGSTNVRTTRIDALRAALGEES